MSHPLTVDSAAPSDSELIAAVRAGDGQAYGQLFERHRDAATRLARQLAGSSDADDLVSDAFIKVLRILSTGGGPDVAFRAYLLTAVRRLHVDRIRAASRVTPTDELEQFDPGVPFSDPAVANFENVAASKAFASLPERWQMVLWHVEVEGQKPAEIAPLMGLSANSVSALAYRAREGLRQAYLQMHLADTAAENCRWVTEHLGAHVRGGLSKRDAAKVDEHLDECPRCAAVYLELTEVNSNLAGILAPLLLGSAAAGYLSSTGTATAGLGAWLLKAKEVVKAHGSASAGTAAASVVAVGVAAVVIAHGGADPKREIASDVPIATTPAIDSSVPAPSVRPGAKPPGDAGPRNPAPPDRPGRSASPPVLLAPITTSPATTTTPFTTAVTTTQPTTTLPDPATTLPTTTFSVPTTTISVPTLTIPTVTQPTSTTPTTAPSTSVPTTSVPTTTVPTTEPTTVPTTEPTTVPTTVPTTTTEPPAAPVSIHGVVVSNSPSNHLDVEVQITAPASGMSVVRLETTGAQKLTLDEVPDWDCTYISLTWSECLATTDEPGVLPVHVHFFTTEPVWELAATLTYTGVADDGLAARWSWTGQPDR